MDRKKIDALTFDLPWCVESKDISRLSNTLTTFIRRQTDLETGNMRKNFDNFNYLYGNSKMRWSSRYGVPVNTDFLASMARGERVQQTNITRVIAESLMAYLFSNEADINCDAVDKKNLKTKKLAKISESRVKYLSTKIGLNSSIKTSSQGMVCYGNAVAMTEWKRNAGKLVSIPVMRKVRKPIMTESFYEDPIYGAVPITRQEVDENGMPQYELVEEPDIDFSTGEPRQELKWTGEVAVTYLSPFEYIREKKILIDDAKWHARIRVMYLDEYFAEYKDLKGRVEENYERVSPGLVTAGVASIRMQYFLRMVAFQYTNFEYGGGYSSLSKEVQNMVLVVDYFDAPTDVPGREHGRRIVHVNGMVTHVTQPDFHYEHKGGWHPFSEGMWLNAPPSNTASGPLDDATYKNNDVNFLDRLMGTSSRRFLGGTMLVKTGAFDTQLLSGEPGKIIQTPMDLNSVMKAFTDPHAIPDGAIKLKEINTQDAYTVSGAGEGLRGDKVPGITSAYGQKIIEERAQQRIIQAKRSFESMVQSIYEKVITCDQTWTNFNNPEESFKMAKMIGSEISVDDLLNYSQANINYGLQIRVTPNSMSYTSEVAEQAEVRELIQQTPFGGYVFSRPELIDAFHKYFKLDAFNTTPQVQRDAAENNCEIFLEMLRGGQVNWVPIPLEEYDPMIHIPVVNNFATQYASELMQPQNERTYAAVTTYRKGLEMRFQMMQQMQPTGGGPKKPSQNQPTPPNSQGTSNPTAANPDATVTTGNPHSSMTKEAKISEGVVQNNIAKHV